MELTYKGGNCVVVNVKKELFVIDGKISPLGLNDIALTNAVYLSTQVDLTPEHKDGMVFDGPGDYEVRGVSVKGLAAPRMVDHDNSKQSTIYRIIADGISIVVIGHVRAPLSEEELEAIGLTDIAIVPIGGNGYTLDAHQASNVIGQLEPKVVIPTHYADDDVTYEVPQQGLEEFASELGADREKMPAFKIKNASLPMKLTLVELTRS